MEQSNKCKKCIHTKLEEACMVAEELTQETISIKRKHLTEKEAEDAIGNINQRTISKSGS